MKLITRKIIGIIAKPFCLGYSSCGHCGRPWPICNEHATMYTWDRGCFPLCEDCWSELTIEERWPYYLDLWSRWSSEDENKLELMRRAVMEGK